MKLVKAGHKEVQPPEHLIALFEAMKSGHVIKSVTCCPGVKNREKTETYFKIENFTALEYHVKGHSSARENQSRCDYVVTDKEGSTEIAESGGHGTFYMSWVIGFEL